MRAPSPTARWRREGWALSGAVMSELQTQGHLHLAVAVSAQTAGDDSKGCRGHAAAGIREVWRVGQIVEFRPVFQAEAFGEGEYTEDRDIVVGKPGPADGVPARATEPIRPRGCERPCAEPRLPGPDTAQVTDRRDGIGELSVAGAVARGRVGRRRKRR